MLNLDHGYPYVLNLDVFCPFFHEGAAACVEGGEGEMKDYPFQFRWRKK